MRLPNNATLRGLGDYLSLLSYATGVHVDRRLIQMIHEQHESLWIYTTLWIQIWEPFRKQKYGMKRATMI